MSCKKLQKICNFKLFIKETKEMNQIIAQKHQITSYPLRHYVSSYESS